MSLVYVIEDNPMMAECIAMAARSREQLEPNGQKQPPFVMIFNDAVTAMKSLDEDTPDVILLDILLTGPDGFTFLNELVSYKDTASIPVVLITSLDLSDRNLEHYGVIGTLSKSTMTPEDIQAAIAAALEKKYADQTVAAPNTETPPAPALPDPELSNTTNAE